MRKAEKGFTLIELLVVIAIIGILAVLVLANLGSARAKARDGRRKSDLRNIQSALELYYNDNDEYPTEGDGDLDPGDLTSQYIGEVPTDPSDGASYLYDTGANSAGTADQAYAVRSEVENTNDAEKVTIGGTDYFIKCGGTFADNSASPFDEC